MLYRIAVVELSGGKWAVVKITHTKLKDRHHVAYFLGDSLSPLFDTMSRAFEHAHEVHSLLARIAFQQTIVDDPNEDRDTRALSQANIHNLRVALSKLTGVRHHE